MINKQNFVSPDDPILMKVAKEIPAGKINSPETEKVIDKMLMVAFGEQSQKDKPLLVGLAAPQIGISKRIILVDIKADGKGAVGDLRVFINPEIIFKSEEENEWYEGCFSTSNVCGIVSRPNRIKLKAFDKDGKIFEGEFSGYSARIFQHEVDHLDGKEFTTHIKDDNNLHWVEDEEFPEYRNHGAWRNWSNKCPRKKWEKIKGIER